MERFVVSVHVPKTAGTSLATIYERCFARRVLYDYDGYRNVAPDPLIAAHREFVERWFAVLHGHFAASKYVGLFPEAAFVATLRHPVARILSQYAHEWNDASSDSLYHAALVSGRMDVVDFAAIPSIGGAMAAHLEGRALAEYDALLIAERMMESLQVFDAVVRKLSLETHFGAPPVLPRNNQASARGRPPEVTRAQCEAVAARAAEDMALYAEAVSLLDRRLGRRDAARVARELSLV